MVVMGGIALPPCTSSEIVTTTDLIAIGATLINVESLYNGIESAPVGSGSEAVKTCPAQFCHGHGLCHLLPAGEVGGGGMAVHGVSGGELR